jgi:hemolysin activation/secretion protein
MKIKLFFLMIFLPFWILGDVGNVELAKNPLTDPDLTPQEIQEILFLGNWDQVRRHPKTSSQLVRSKGVVLLDQNPNFLSGLGDEYIGKLLTENLIESLKEEVADLYKKNKQPFVAIHVPRYYLSEGILQVVVEEAKLGTILTKGNEYYTPEQLKSFIRAKPGEPIDMVQLTQDLTRMNQNPFRRTDLIFRPGPRPDLTDLELVTIDRWPYRIYMGGDNTGTAPTDRDRLFFGFNFSKTFIKDGEIAYQFTCAPNWNLFYSHTASCRIPCPKRQTLILFGGYSQVQPKFTTQKELSTSWQVDGRYRFPIITNSNYLQEIIVGYDFKQVQNQDKTGSRVTSRADADINQFMVGYDVGQRAKSHKVSFVVELYANPGGITTRNKASDYRKFRYAAGPNYGYLKMSHSFACQINPNFWFSYDINAQLATKNLLPSEQLTLTGYNAVRGFEERVANVDNGVLVNTSLETAHWSLGKSFGLTKKAFDELFFLLFFDCGLGVDHKTAPGKSAFVNLASIGPGVRYQIDRWFSARFDYGFQLWHHGFHNPTDSRYNFGLMMSY